MKPAILDKFYNILKRYSSKKKIIRAINRHVLRPFKLTLKNTEAAAKNAVFDAFDCEEQALKHLPLIQKHTMIPPPGLITLYQQVKYIEDNHIPGDFVEAGVWKGGASGMMALAQLDTGAPVRHMHLFDSFQGLPKASKFDGDKDRAWLGEVSHNKNVEVSEGGQDLAVDESCVLDLFSRIAYPKENTHIWKGWFQDTILEYAKTKPQIALLRLDGDLYESTKVCLDHLWDLVVPNGVIVIDDYLSGITSPSARCSS